MITVIDRARALAYYAHQHQMYGDDPYTVHLDFVVEQVKRFSYLLPEDLREVVTAAAYLHDTLEDTYLHPYIISEECGTRVLKIVEAVTSDTTQSRRDRLTPEYFERLTSTEGAVFLKLCDRIANTTRCIGDPRYRSLLRMYQKEYPLFKKILFEERYKDLFDELRRLCECSDDY